MMMIMGFFIEFLIFDIFFIDDDGSRHNIICVQYEYIQ